MADLKFDNLKDCLHDFQNTFNNHRLVKKLLKKWNRSILVDATDTGSQFTLVVQNLEMTAVEKGLVYDESDEFRVHLQAEENTLIQIFSGDYNPASAHIDGALAVFSNDKDKVKLEAIAMVIWGL